MILRVVKMTFHPEKMEDFFRIFSEVKSKITDFEGCLELQLLQDCNQSNILFTQSKWSDQDALNAYRNSELFEATWAKTKMLFAEKAEAWSLEHKSLL